LTRIPDWILSYIGVVEPFPEKCERLQELHSRNIPIYHSLEQFYNKHTADLAVISSPIQYHCTQSCLAVSQGSYVLCEKPLCATVAEAQQMLETQAKHKNGSPLATSGPAFHFEFADAVVKGEYKEGSLNLKAHFVDGHLVDYGSPDADDMQKLWQCIKHVNTGCSIACGVEAASSHTFCVNAAQKSMPEIVDLPSNLIHETGSADRPRIYMDGLDYDVMGNLGLSIRSEQFCCGTPGFVG